MLLSDSLELLSVKASKMNTVITKDITEIDTQASLYSDPESRSDDDSPLGLSVLLLFAERGS